MHQEPLSVALHLQDPSVSAEESSLLAALEVLQARGFQGPLGELSVAIIDDPAIAQIHADFMDDPTPTDVITFEGSPDPEEPLAGEIVISLDHARSAAREAGTTPEAELTLYFVHGWLHLCGFSDLKEADRAAMRRAEQQALAALRDAGLSPLLRVR